MKISKGRLAARLLMLVAAVGVVSLLAPFINADRHRPRLRKALESALGNRVELGAIRYRLLPQPGLLSRNVVIYQDPEFGLDALAYVDELAVDLRWWSLAAGRWDVAAVRLVHASLNVVRRESGEWGLRPMLSRLSTHPGLAPRVLIENGRINFSTGTLKSPYYLSNVELDLDATTRGIEWQYEASPARTDRSEQGFGRFEGSGKWLPGEGSGGLADVELSLERSATSEVSMLLAGRDLGLQGRVLSRARLFGPPNRIKVTGSLEFEGLERSGLLGFRGPRMPVPYEGVLDLTAQRLDLATAKAEQLGLPISVEVHAANFLGNLTRETRFRFDELPAKTLLELGRRLGQTLPEGLGLDGTLTGEITVADASVSGAIELVDPRVELAGGGALTAPSARVTIDNNDIVLAPANILAGTSAAEVEGRYSTAFGLLQFQATVRELPAARLKEASGRVPGSKAIPLVSDLAQGRLSGTIGFNSGEPAGPWSADLELAGGRLEPPGLASPVELQRAQLRLRGEQWTLRRIQGMAHGIAFAGEVSHTPAARRPYRFLVTAGDVNGTDLEELLRPALGTGSGRGLWERALRLRGAARPAWLRARRAEGVVALRSLVLGTQTLTPVKGLAYWDGPSIEWPEVTARWNDSPVRGRLRIDTSGAEPAYRFQGQADNLAWHSGLVDVEMDLRATGFGQALLESLSVDGTFQARNLVLEGEPLRQASGALTLQMDRLAPRVRLRGLEVQTGGEIYTGQGALLPDGRVAIELVNPRRPLRLAFDLSGRN